MKYADFLEQKHIRHENVGFSKSFELNDKLFDFQKLIVTWALRKGKCALFADTGLGKTPMQLEWAKHVHNETQKPIQSNCCQQGGLPGRQDQILF